MSVKITLFQRIFGSSLAGKNTKETQEDDNAVFPDTVISAEYRKALTSRADMLSSMSNDIFYNKGEDAAKLTLGIIISRAMEMEEVVIYSHSLGPLFYKDVLRGLKCPARILLDDPTGMSVIQGLPQVIQDRINVRVRISPQEVSRSAHFLATDYAFRYDDARGSELSGWVNLNDPLRTKKWREHFEKLWEKSVHPSNVA